MLGFISQVVAGLWYLCKVRKSISSILKMLRLRLFQDLVVFIDVGLDLHRHLLWFYNAFGALLIVQNILVHLDTLVVPNERGGARE